MCVIGIFDKIPSMKELKKMEKTNPHGAGIAWVKNGLVNYVKGKNLTSKQIMKIIKREKIKDNFVIHYRITSSGTTCDELTHPFIINADGNNPQIYQGKESLLVHNGTIQANWEEWLIQTCASKGIKLPSGKLSDSRAIAFLIYHLGENILNLIDLESEKFCIISTEGIKQYGSFVKSKGILCSNNYHNMSFNTFDDHSWYYDKSDNYVNDKDLCQKCLVNDIMISQEECIKHDEYDKLSMISYDEYDELYEEKILRGRKYEKN